MSLTFGPAHAWGVGPPPDQSLFLKYWGCQPGQNIPIKMELSIAVPKARAISNSSEQSILSTPPHIYTKSSTESDASAKSTRLEHSNSFSEAPSLFLERRSSFEPPETLFLSRASPRFSFDTPQNPNMPTIDGTIEDNFVDDFANADIMDINQMPEPPELPPPLFPGPSQTNYGASMGASFVGLSQPRNEREANRVAAARKEAIDTATYNYRCGSPYCAQVGVNPPPPVLYRQKAFSFREEIMVTCIACKKQERLVVLY